MDLLKLKRMVEEAKARSGSGNARIWKPSPGLNTIRAIPYIHDPSLPFIELRFHYSEVSKRPILSPSSPCIGKPDPILEFGLKLQSEAGGDKELWVRGKRLEPKSRFYLPILVRGKEHEGVKFWGFGMTIFENLYSKITNPKWGDFTDLMEGRDIDITYTKPTPADKFGKTIIDVSPERSPATTDEGVLALMKDMPRLESLFTIPTYEELEEILAEYISRGTENDESDVSDADNMDNIVENDGVDDKRLSKSDQDVVMNASGESQHEQSKNDDDSDRMKKAFESIFKR